MCSGLFSGYRGLAPEKHCLPELPAGDRALCPNKATHQWGMVCFYQKTRVRIVESKNAARVHSNSAGRVGTKWILTGQSEGHLLSSSFLPSWHSHFPLFPFPLFFFLSSKCQSIGPGTKTRESCSLVLVNVGFSWELKEYAKPRAETLKFWFHKCS